MPLVFRNSSLFNGCRILKIFQNRKIYFKFLKILTFLVPIFFPNVSEIDSESFRSLPDAFRERSCHFGVPGTYLFQNIDVWDFSIYVDPRAKNHKFSMNNYAQIK